MLFVFSAEGAKQSGGQTLLHRIAQLAIAAPRRVIAFAVLLTVALGIFGVPVAKSLSASGFQDPTSESARATQFLTDKFHQGDVQLLIVVSTPDGVDSAPARAVGNEIVDQLRSSPHVAQVTLAMDRAAACRRGSGQPRPHVGTHRGGHHRRREPAAEVRQGVVRPGGARPRRRHRPVGWNRDGQRPDHRAVAARPAGDGVAGDPAEFSRAGLGVRWPGGRRAAGGRRCDGDPRRDSRFCG